ncbi:MAG: DUF2484 family protein [Pseudomonadota bacterium]
MALATVLMGLWVLLAFIMAAIPSNDNHWRRAYLLMAIGIPLLIWVTWTEGILLGLLGLLIGCSVFRWPVYFMWQWIKKKVGAR